MATISAQLSGTPVLAEFHFDGSVGAKRYGVTDKTLVQLMALEPDKLFEAYKAMGLFHVEFYKDVHQDEKTGETLRTSVGAFDAETEKS